MIDSAKNERVFVKRYEQWVEAAYAMEKKIEAYEMYSWLVSELREGFFFVDAESGFLRNLKEMESAIQVAAELMREIPNIKVHAVAERLERQKGELVKYLVPLNAVVQPLSPLQEELMELQAQACDAFHDAFHKGTMN